MSRQSRPHICAIKKAIRAVNNLDFNAHTSDSYLNMKTLKLEDLYMLKINAIMHYAVHYRGYDYLSGRLCMYSNNHNFDTRTSNLFVLPRYRLSKSQINVLYFGIKLSNSLLNQYFYLSLPMFKNAIRVHFVSQYSN